MRYVVKLIVALEVHIMTKKEEVISLADRYIRDVPGFPKPGIIFKDITPVFENPEYCEKTIEVMVDEIKEKVPEFDKIICPEARGFLFGVPIGLQIQKPVILARKPGKLPLPGMRIDYALEYGTESLEISKGALNPGEKILIVDDLLATGGSAKALSALVEKSGAQVAGIIFYIELTPLKGRDLLKDYKVLSIVPVEAY